MISWRYIQLIGIIFCGVMCACAALYGSILLAILGLGVGMPVIYFSGKTSKKMGETMEDERTLHISQSSSLTTCLILFPTLGILAVILIVLGDSIGEWASVSGMTISCVVLAFFVIYLSLYLLTDRGMEKNE